ncbi:acylneuraminate cytidylyltransferase family protein [Metabacillus halosaccharovorans]|uniref:acylneuraminate cytidylyltransferase family protein n=1 Tax=Metabacillus halosaccharovorans TaxID=930124 RepID=UPI00373662C3
MLGITLARGGSKRLPGKNIKKLNGVPLIEYTIKSAKRSKLITRYMISTDSPEIAEVAINAGAEVPFLRPGYLAEDHSNPIDACLHVLSEYKSKEGYEPEILVLLQPTSPLRTEINIDEAIKLFQYKKADSVLSVCSLEYHTNSIMTMEKQGTITPFTQNKIYKECNTDNSIYRLNGAIYIVKTSYLKQNKSFYSTKTFPYVMSRNQSIDIDTEFDFQMASLLLRKDHS